MVCLGLWVGGGAIYSCGVVWRSRGWVRVRVVREVLVGVSVRGGYVEVRGCGGSLCTGVVFAGQSVTVDVRLFTLVFTCVLVTVVGILICVGEGGIYRGRSVLFAAIGELVWTQLCLGSVGE